MVSKTLALLSGKGGSGKTTLALSMATMLADCGIKVLLVDCDLSTNGATYFYEDKLPGGHIKTTSFFDILFNKSRGDYQFINISSNFDFLPSISQISKENTSTYSYHPDENREWKNFYYQVCQKYDVVLFDCQAGYTDMLKTILPMIDINLYVMEADAISSSSIRSLYLKIGNITNKKKVYQLFNKVTEEEHEVYSKLIGGTVFTNIEAIFFDWKIRKAFSIAKVPDMRNSSARYGEQICDICNILFKDKIIQEHLQQFELVIKMNKNIEDEKTIQDKINSIKEERGYMRKKQTKSMYKLLLFVSVILSVSAFYILVESGLLGNIFERSVFNTKFLFPSIITVFITIVSIVLNYINVLDTTKEQRNNYKELEIYQKLLRQAINEREEIQVQLKHFETHITNIKDNTLADN